MGAMMLEFHATYDCGREDWHCENGDGSRGLQWAGGVRLARFFDDRAFGDHWRDKVVLELEPDRASPLCAGDAGV